MSRIPEVSFIISIYYTISIQILKECITGTGCTQRHLRQNLFTICIDLQFAIRIKIILLQETVEKISIVQSGASSCFRHIRFVGNHFVHIYDFVFGIRHIRLYPIIHLSCAVIPSKRHLISMIIHFTQINFRQLYIGNGRQSITRRQDIFSLLKEYIGCKAQSRIKHLKINTIILLCHGFPGHIRIAHRILLCIRQQSRTAFLSELPASLILFDGIVTIPRT